MKKLMIYLPILVLASCAQVKTLTVKSEGGVFVGSRTHIESAYAKARKSNVSAVDKKYSFDTSEWKKASKEETAAKPQLTLRGDVVTSDKEATVARVLVYLNKPLYNDGHVVFVHKDGTKENLQINSFEKHESLVNGRFENIYILSDSNGKLSHLFVYGGLFGKPERFALEATILFPKSGKVSPVGAISVDLGGSFLTKSEYQLEIDKMKVSLDKSDSILVELQTASDTIADDVKTIASLETDIAEREKENAANTAERAKDKDSKPEDLKKEEAKDQKALADLNVKLQDAKKKKKTDEESFENLRVSSEKQVISTQPIRLEISKLYADFIQSNRYTWATAAEQKGFNDSWSAVNALDASVTEHQSRLETLSARNENVATALKETRVLVNKFNNKKQQPVEPNPWIVVPPAPVEPAAAVEPAATEEPAAAVEPAATEEPVATEAATTE